jgi:hypothetical protein
VTEKIDAIRSAENALSMRFPEAYALWLQDSEGFEADLGGCYLSLYAVGELVERNRAYEVAAFVPGLILIGTNGAGEGIGLDTRGQGAPVVMVNLTSLRWEEAIYQAESFGQFLKERLRGHPLRWEVT